MNFIVSRYDTHLVRREVTRKIIIGRKWVFKTKLNCLKKYYTILYLKLVLK